MKSFSVSIVRFTYEKPLHMGYHVICIEGLPVLRRFN